MTAAHCPGCTGHRVLSISGPLVTAQFGQPCPGVQDGRAELVQALRETLAIIESRWAIDPTCADVLAWREARIAEWRAALALAGLREHAGTWITEDEDRRISADGP